MTRQALSHDSDLSRTPPPGKMQLVYRVSSNDSRGYKVAKGLCSGSSGGRPDSSQRALWDKPDQAAGLVGGADEEIRSSIVMCV